MPDHLHIPKRLRDRARNGHDHTRGLIVPDRFAGTSVVPASWADSPAPRMADKVQAFVQGLVDAKDGRTHNAYVCDACKAAFHTVDAHPGVTPLAMSHHMFAATDCLGRCISQGYPAGRIPDELGEPTHEWYRPSGEALEQCTPRVVDHVMRGGLLLRRA